MKRRGFARIAATALTLTWPAWLARAFAQVDDPPEASEALALAIAHGRASGRPVFVIVVPTASELRWERGHAWGELLSQADDALVVLALADVVCGGAAAVRALVPGTPDGDPVAIVIEPTGEVDAYDAELPRIGELDSEAAIDARIDALTQLVHRALIADAHMTDRRIRAARAALGDSLEPLDRAIESGPTAVLPDQAADAPALVYAAMLASSGQPDSLVWRARLLDVAVTRLRRSSIPGSRWGLVEPFDCPLCGMGFTPERSRRFLDWLVTP